MTKPRILTIVAITGILSIIALFPYIAIAGLAILSSIAYVINLIFKNKFAFIVGLGGLISIWEIFSFTKYLVKLKNNNFTQKYGTLALSLISITLAGLISNTYIHNIYATMIIIVLISIVMATLVKGENAKLIQLCKKIVNNDSAGIWIWAALFMTIGLFLGVVAAGAYTLKLILQG